MTEGELRAHIMGELAHLTVPEMIMFALARDINVKESEPSLMKYTIVNEMVKKYRNTKTA